MKSIVLIHQYHPSRLARLLAYLTAVTLTLVTLPMGLLFGTTLYFVNCCISFGRMAVEEFWLAIRGPRNEWQKLVPTEKRPQEWIRFFMNAAVGGVASPLVASFVGFK